MINKDVWQLLCARGVSLCVTRTGRERTKEREWVAGWDGGRERGREGGIIRVQFFHLSHSIPSHFRPHPFFIPFYREPIIASLGARAVFAQKAWHGMALHGIWEKMKTTKDEDEEEEVEMVSIHNMSKWRRSRSVEVDGSFSWLRARCLCTCVWVRARVCGCGCEFVFPFRGPIGFPFPFPFLFFLALSPIYLFYPSHPIPRQKKAQRPTCTETFPPPHSQMQEKWTGPTLPLFF